MIVPVLWPTSKARGIFLSAAFLILQAVILLAALAAPILLRLARK